MIDWSRWLPGLGQDEPEEEESAVTKTLRALGQGAQDVGQGISQYLPGASPAPSIPDTRAADQGPWEQPYPGTVSPIRNPDGSVTTERSITVTEPDVNQGQPSNIPTVWSGRVVPDEEAITNASYAGTGRFPSYPSIDEAVSAAEQRSRDLGAGQATSVGGATVPPDVIAGGGHPEAPRASALGRIGEALGSAASAVSDAYAVPVEQRPPQYGGPSYAQPSLAPGQPSMLEQASDGVAGAGSGVVEGAQAGLAAADQALMGPKLTAPTWEDPLAPVRDVGQHIREHPLSVLPAAIYGQVQQAATEPIGARAVEAAGGSAEPGSGFDVTIPESVPLVGGTRINPSQQDVGGFASSAILDPFNYVGAAGAGLAGRGLRHVAAEAARGLPLVGESEALLRGGAGLVRRGVGAASDVLGANAARTTAADIPGVQHLGSGVVPEPAPGSIQRGPGGVYRSTEPRTVPNSAAARGIDSLYHETSPRDAFSLTSEIGTDALTGRYVSPDPTFALGQGGKGARIELGATEQLRVERGRAKPGLGMMEATGQGNPELVIADAPYPPGQYIRSITVAPDAQMDRVARGISTRLERDGWEVEALPDGSRRWTPPEPPRTQVSDASWGDMPRRLGSGIVPRLRADAFNAAQGGVMGAASEDLQAQQEGREADPAEMARRALIGGGLATVAGSRAARRAGQELGSGFLGIGGRPANQAAAAAPNPIMQRMAQQMAGQHAPSGVTNKRGLGEWWAQAMTDDRAGLRHFQDAVSRSIGRPLSAHESVAELTRVNPASVASQRIDEGLRGALQKVGDDEDYLAQYLVHSHNVDVAREIGQRAHDAAITAGRTPQEASQAAMRAANTRQFSGDLRLGETLQQLTDIEQRVKSLPDGDDRWQAIQDAGQAIWNFNKQTLERKRDAGIISDGLYNDLTTKYPKYVRTDIADYFDKGTGGPAPAGKRLGVSDIGIQKISATGTAKERVNPLLSTIDQTYSAEAAIARNEAGKAFEELTRLDPAWQSTFKEVVPAQGVNIGNPATTVPASYTLKNGEQFLRVWDGGQARTYVIPKEYAALVAPQTGRVLGDSGAAKAATSAMNIYKSLITSKNPAFSMLVSPLRDAGDYAIREATLSAKDQGLKGAVQAIGSVPGVMADYAKAIPDAFAGILEGTYKGDLGRMMKEGAGQVSRPGRDQGELRAALGELQRTNGLEVKNTGDLMKLVGNVLTLGAEPIGGRIEQVPRLAAARRAGRRGASDLGQAMSFRDATVDFQRAGEWSRVINSVVPFFNVAMQGGAQTARTFKANPAAFMASVAGTVGTATIAAEAWNNADPQRQADYEDVPDYLKRTGLVVMLPGVEGQSARGDALPNYVWIPVGQYGALVQTAKEAAKNAVAGKPGADLGSFSGWAELGAEVAGIFSPIRGDSAGGMVSSLIPPGLSTAAELSANRDLFRGSTIATERKNEQASALSQGSAAVANALTGQETQPSQWEYLYKDLGGYGATLGLEASNLAAEKLGMRPPKADERPIQDIPVVGGLVNRVIRDAGGQRLEDATGDVSRVPESIRPILAEVGMRRDQLAPVGSRYRGATLSREEQERWQSTVNDYLVEDVLAARDSAAWGDPTKRAQAVQQAVTKAKARAAKDALGLTEGDIRERIERERSRKAG